jgi:hypothetical protein
MKKLQEQDEARIERDRELIDKVVKALMLNEIEEIEDRQKEAGERYDRNLDKIHRKHARIMKEIEKKYGGVSDNT